MSLSPYLKPTNLNGGMQSSYLTKGSEIYSKDGDAFDKRTGNKFSEYSDVVSLVSDWSDAIENVLGSRSPMYVIGEIENETWGSRNSKYMPNAISGLVRAVSNLSGGTKQEGVIIDGLGDVDGNFSVEFTSNPVLFRGSNIIDNRFRAPSKLRMTVFVSDYLNDDGTGIIADAISGIDPTGIAGEIAGKIGRAGNTRAQWALYQLRWLMENAQPFSVYTPHGVYDNMVIKSLSPRTNADTMEMLYCDIEFQELILYAPYTTDIGKIPARKGITSVRSGWTAEARKNANILW